MTTGGELINIRKTFFISFTAPKGTGRTTFTNDNKKGNIIMIKFMTTAPMLKEQILTRCSLNFLSLFIIALLHFQLFCLCQIGNKAKYVNIILEV